MRRSVGDSGPFHRLNPIPAFRAMSPRPSWLRVLPLVVVMTLLFVLSHQPGDTLPLPAVVNLDKLLHLMAYTTLGLSFLLALPPDWRTRRPRAMAVCTVLFCLCYGLSDEFHQRFVPGRFSGVDDLVFDTLGGLLAVTIDRARHRWTSRRSRANTMAGDQ